MNDIQPITLPGIDPRRPLVIAGPCSAETEEQVLGTARSLAAEGIRICRAGLWKPRTKPGGFEGVGEAGIAWLQRVKRETGMYTSTEVATREHVATALKGGVDLLWIGARTAANPKKRNTCSIFCCLPCKRKKARDAVRGSESLTRKNACVAPSTRDL
jgi:chorismate mutase